MRAIPKLLLLLAIGQTMTTWAAPAFALAERNDNFAPAPASQAKPMFFADAKKKKAGGAKKGGKGVREKFLTGEASTKGKDSTKVDFDAADIGGQRKTPLGTLINQNKADKNYDFVKIRLRWHPEMVQSASSLDAGAGN